MTEYVNGRIPKIYSQEGLSRAVQTLQREMNDVQQVMSPQYLKEIEPAFNALKAKIDRIADPVSREETENIFARLEQEIDNIGVAVRRVESKLGRMEKEAHKALYTATQTDKLFDKIADIHNAFVDDVTARLDALESRHKKPVAAQTYPGTDAGIQQAITDAKRWTRENPYGHPPTKEDGTFDVENYHRKPAARRGYTGPGWLTMAEGAKEGVATPREAKPGWLTAAWVSGDGTTVYEDKDGHPHFSGNAP